MKPPRLETIFDVDDEIRRLTRELELRRWQRSALLSALSEFPDEERKLHATRYRLLHRIKHSLLRLVKR